MPTLQQLTKPQAEASLESLVLLLQNVVDNGASIGFIPPLPTQEAQAYWTKVIANLEQGHLLLFVVLAEEQVIGTAQLALEMRKNGLHRAEVQKVMVHTEFRGRGIGRQLMDAVEAAAHTAQRTLLVLDTRRGDVAETLYQKLGYVQAGIIPGYASNATGGLDDTVLYYRIL